MRSIKEIADSCNVSKTTVNRAIKELSLEPTVYKNKHLFDDSQVEQILHHITETERKPKQQTETESAVFETETKQAQQTETGPDNTNSLELQIIRTLEEQLKIKDLQIKDLSEKLDRQIELNQFKTQQIALLTTTQTETEEKTEQKVHWWEKFFK